MAAPNSLQIRDGGFRPLAADGEASKLPGYNEQTFPNPGGRCRLKLMDWALAGLLTVANRALKTFYKIRIPRDAAQRIIEARFPIRREKYGFALSLTEPQVRLNASANRIGIEISLRVTLPGGASQEWRGLIEVRLHYQREQGAFFLLEPVLRPLDPSAAGPSPRNVVLKIAEAALDSVLSATPVYTLNQNNFKHLLAQLLLKSVTVEPDHLRVELSLY